MKKQHIELVILVYSAAAVSFAPNMFHEPGKY